MDAFGSLLRTWRQARGYSQLTLGLAADVSAKHISFLETGRAHPSRSMLTQLAAVLDIPLADRNILLRSAGFKEDYSRMELDQEEMAPVRHAIHHMMESHDPFPAVVMDQEWNILTMNTAYEKFMAILTAIQPEFPSSRNTLELLFNPKGLRPFVENWDTLAALLLQRLQKQILLQNGHGAELLEKLLQYPDVPAAWHKAGFTNPVHPMVSLNLRLGEKRLNLFSSLSQFGTAIDITMQQIVIEQYFPTDDATREFLEQMA